MKITPEPRLMGTLIDQTSPESVVVEVKRLLRRVYPDVDAALFDASARTVIALYRGEYPGYLACNIGFHDLKHTTDTLLALMRLIHGASLVGVVIPAREAVIALSAAMLHDTGYIQREDEAEGTGARFGPVHEERSIAFAHNYFRTLKIKDRELDLCTGMIRCTSFQEDIKMVPFATVSGALLGKMLATADLVGQFADRTYLEKLLFLYREFDEGEMGDYTDEFDLLRRTIDFHTLVDRRLRIDLNNMSRYFRPHFNRRWNIDGDLYEMTIRRNLEYLHYILTHHPHDYREKLNRGGLIDQLEALEATDKCQRCL